MLRGQEKRDQTSEAHEADGLQGHISEQCAWRSDENGTGDEIQTRHAMKRPHQNSERSNDGAPICRYINAVIIKIGFRPLEASESNSVQPRGPDADG